MLFLSCQKKPGSLSSSMSHTAVLCSEESAGRRPGTAGHDFACDYITAQFEALGLEKMSEEFVVEGNARTFINIEKASLSLTDAQGQEKELSYGKDFNILGLKNLEGIHRDDLKGLNSLKEVSLRFQSPLKFKGLEETDLFCAENIICIAEDIQNDLDFEQLTNFHLTPTYKKISLSPKNILGVLKGQDGSKAIVLSAHYDHCGQFGPVTIPGAFDNAGGVSLLLHLARQFEQEPPCDVVFAAFDMEESNFLGSLDSVPFLTATYERLLNLNFDCVGFREKDSYSLEIQSFHKEAYGPLAKFLSPVFSKEFFKAQQNPLESKMNSDQLSFTTNASCIAALSIYDSAFLRTHFIHSKEDVAAMVSEEEIIQVAERVYQDLFQTDILPNILNLSLDTLNEEEKQEVKLLCKNEQQRLFERAGSPFPYEVIFSIDTPKNFLETLDIKLHSEFCPANMDLICYFKEEPILTDIKTSLLNCDDFAIIVIPEKNNFFFLSNRLPPQNVEKISFESETLKGKSIQVAFWNDSFYVKWPQNDQVYFLSTPSLPRISPEVQKEQVLSTLLLEESQEFMNTFDTLNKKINAFRKTVH